MKIEKYIIGTRPAPKWAAERLTPYKKMDGTTGFEFYGTRRTFEVDTGDELVKTGDVIELIYKKNRKENT